jgi:hypothetical protein
VRELLRRFDGREADGAAFNSPERVVLPRFERVEPYRSEDGQVELDALAETLEGTRWIVEVKWRGRGVGVKEVEILAGLSREFVAQAWLVSRTGFTGAAVELGRKNRVFLSDREGFRELQRLSRLWRIRRSSRQGLSQYLRCNLDPDFILLDSNGKAVHRPGRRSAQVAAVECKEGASAGFLEATQFGLPTDEAGILKSRMRRPVTQYRYFATNVDDKPVQVAKPVSFLAGWEVGDHANLDPLSPRQGKP